MSTPRAVFSPVHTRSSVLFFGLVLAGAGGSEVMFGPHRYGCCVDGGLSPPATGSCEIKSPGGESCAGERNGDKTRRGIYIPPNAHDIWFQMGLALRGRDGWNRGFYSISY